MEKISSIMKMHYAETFHQYGANIQGVDWGNKNDIEKLELRYEKMLNVIKHSALKMADDNISILDVGCGYGGLHEYALNNDFGFDYTGIDVCENMIEYAKEADKEGKYILGDILEYSSKENYTFIICNGILTQKFDVSVREMDEYARKLIRKMWSLSTKGIVFNIMKSQVDFMNENLYYKSPLEILGYCMTLTDKFILDSSYPLYEYSVYLYKV